MTIAEQIERIRRQLINTRPRSMRRAMLECRLCVLMTRQLKLEIRKAG